jgi:hypothetical protein
MAASKSTLVKINEYSLPKGKALTGTLICGVLMFFSASRKFVEPGSILHDNLLIRSTAVHKRRFLIQNVIFWFLYGAHSIEVVVFALTKLRKHGVNPLSWVGLRWCASVFVGGVYVQGHWDEIVRQKEMKAIN